MKARSRGSAARRWAGRVPRDAAKLSTAWRQNGQTMANVRVLWGSLDETVAPGGRPPWHGSRRRAASPARIPPQRRHEWRAIEEEEHWPTGA